MLLVLPWKARALCKDRRDCCDEMSGQRGTYPGPVRDCNLKVRAPKSPKLRGETVTFSVHSSDDEKVSYKFMLDTAYWYSI